MPVSMTFNRVWEIWPERRFGVSAWATRQRPFVLFNLEIGAFLGKGECQPSASVGVTLCNAGIRLNTYRWANKDK